MENLKNRVAGTAIGACAGLAGLAAGTCSGSCPSCFGCAAAGAGVVAALIFGKYRALNDARPATGPAQGGRY